MQTDPNGRFEIESRRAYVVFDERTGEIVHVHRVTTFRGAESLTRDEEEGRAVAMARQFGHAVAGKRVLAVDPDELERGKCRCVDLQTGRLIPERGCEGRDAPDLPAAD
jgi:hypothetical protein